MTPERHSPDLREVAGRVKKFLEFRMHGRWCGDSDLAGPADRKKIIQACSIFSFLWVQFKSRHEADLKCLT
jgi:hypothetical protein